MPADRGDPLFHGWSLAFIDQAVLIGDDLKMMLHHGQKLAGSQEKIRITRFPIVRLADGEGVVEQGAAWRQSVQEIRKERSVEIVHHNDRIETPISERPGRTVFKIGLDDLKPRALGLPDRWPSAFGDRRFCDRAT